MSILTRRNFLGTMAAAAGGLTALQTVVGADHPSDPGPANPALDGQNPDSIWPPSTDSKSLVQNFKYPFFNKRVYEGDGRAEVTVRELPVSRLWRRNMRLTLRLPELHWYTAGEWPSCFTGRRGLARLTRRQEFCCR
jgi:oxalate decarboxylase